MIRILSFILLCSLGLFTGCSGNQEVKDAWKYTSKQYRTYLNVPATLDMDAKGDGTEYQIALAEQVYGLDSELASLVRTMENTGRNITPDWVMTTLRKYPWLTGMALVDGKGTIISQFPEQFPKGLDVAPLLEEDPKQHLTNLRAYVQKSEMGPEVYIANPVYVNSEFRGMVVVHFDPRALAMLSPNPDRFVIASPAGVLWAGSYASTPFVDDTWAEVLTSKAYGYAGSGENEFYWISRYIGNLPLIYGISTGTQSMASQVAAQVEKGAPDYSHAEPLQPAQGVSAGEVGNLGSPNVAPGTVPAQPAAIPAEPLEE